MPNLLQAVLVGGQKFLDSFLPCDNCLTTNEKEASCSALHDIINYVPPTNASEPKPDCSTKTTKDTQVTTIVEPSPLVSSNRKKVSCAGKSGEVKPSTANSRPPTRDASVGVRPKSRGNIDGSTRPRSRPNTSGKGADVRVDPCLDTSGLKPGTSRDYNDAKSVDGNETRKNDTFEFSKVGTGRDGNTNCPEDIQLTEQYKIPIESPRNCDNQNEPGNEFVPTKWVDNNAPCVTDEQYGIKKEKILYSRDPVKNAAIAIDSNAGIISVRIGVSNHISNVAPSRDHQSDQYNTIALFWFLVRFSCQFAIYSLKSFLCHVLNRYRNRNMAELLKIWKTIHVIKTELPNTLNNISSPTAPQFLPRIRTPVKWLWTNPRLRVIPVDQTLSKQLCSHKNLRLT